MDEYDQVLFWVLGFHHIVVILFQVNFINVAVFTVNVIGHFKGSVVGKSTEVSVEYFYIRRFNKIMYLIFQ